MHRRHFLPSSCAACPSLTAASALLSACVGTRYAGGTLNRDGLLLPLKEFEVRQGGSTAFASFVIVRNEALQFPICVYRLDEGRYTALWMRCSHQGAELQASGDVLQCPAHGSEFDREGRASSGPAAEALPRFPVTIQGSDLFIDLRKPS